MFIQDQFHNLKPATLDYKHSVNGEQELDVRERILAGEAEKALGCYLARRHKLIT
jgi:hypothetical protein